MFLEGAIKKLRPDLKRERRFESCLLKLPNGKHNSWTIQTDKTAIKGRLKYGFIWFVWFITHGFVRVWKAEILWQVEGSWSWRMVARLDIVCLLFGPRLIGECFSKDWTLQIKVSSRKDRSSKFLLISNRLFKIVSSEKSSISSNSQMLSFWNPHWISNFGNLFIMKRWARIESLE